jgi:TonB family protein
VTEGASANDPPVHESKANETIAPLQAGVPLFCGAMLLIASSLMCEAAHKEAAHTGQRRAANVSAAGTAKPYGASLSEGQSLRALESEISRKLGSKIQESDYPEEARRQGWSGTTLVGVLVGSNGKIKQVSISQTSGFALLDEQAVRMVDRVSIWWIPQRLRKREVNVAVPVGFYIRDAEPMKGESVQTASRLAALGPSQTFENSAWKLFPGPDMSALYRRTGQTLDWPAFIPVVDALFPGADYKSCRLVGSEQI